MTAIEPARLDEVRRNLGRIGADVPRPEPLGKRGEKAILSGAGVGHRRAGEGIVRLR